MLRSSVETVFMLWGCLIDGLQRHDVGVMQHTRICVVKSEPSTLPVQIGKDRTGLIAALILAICGATEDEIVSDYARSVSPDGIALGGLEKMKELEGARWQRRVALAVV